MTDTTLQLTGAFNRHNSLYNALLGGMKTLTTSHAEEITITLDAQHARALTRILNAAPLDGNPLNTRVNVETDTDAWETEASKINRYLEDNDQEPTLENVEGEEHKAANARAIRYYEPDRIASLGGILMEHITA